MVSPLEVLRTVTVTVLMALSIGTAPKVPAVPLITLSLTTEVVTRNIRFEAVEVVAT